MIKIKGDGEDRAPVRRYERARLRVGDVAQPRPGLPKPLGHDDGHLVESCADIGAQRLATMRDENGDCSTRANRRKYQPGSGRGWIKVQWQVT